jgi:DNA-directed RNA polymerase subunit RPC12/RpoP
VSTPSRSTVCDRCEQLVDLTLDVVLELRILLVLQCPRCGERIAQLKPAELAERRGG